MSKPIIELNSNDLCPYCNKDISDITFEFHLQNNPLCHRDYNDNMVESMIPSDVRQEFRMAHRKHRVLPSGDVEYADEYGGY